VRFSVVRIPGSGAVPAGPCMAEQEPLDPMFSVWETVASGLTKEEAESRAEALNLAKDVMEG